MKFKDVKRMMRKKGLKLVAVELHSCCECDDVMLIKLVMSKGVFALAWPTEKQLEKIQKWGAGQKAALMVVGMDECSECAAGGAAGSLSERAGVQKYLQ